MTRTLNGDGISNPTSFKNEARWQRVCAGCGSAGHFHAHHVVFEQVLKRYTPLRGVELFDTRNALRLCVARCHFPHHSRAATLPTSKLLDCNIEYAFMALGAYAADWLRRYYDDSDPDPRIVKLESGLVRAVAAW